MARYYFDIFDDQVASDEEGLDLPDTEAAMAAALAGAREMACEEIRKGCLHLGHRVEICDESRRVIGTIRYRDAFAIEE
jgi:hypothetical protein